tara:strand:- start:641 stop:1768 length:1128 start_codon:yes stop_codon:yes gene_type:complete
MEALLLMLAGVFAASKMKPQGPVPPTVTEPSDNTGPQEEFEPAFSIGEFHLNYDPGRQLSLSQLKFEEGASESFLTRQNQAMVFCNLLYLKAFLRHCVESGFTANEWIESQVKKVQMESQNQEWYNDFKKHFGNSSIGSILGKLGTFQYSELAIKLIKATVAIGVSSIWSGVTWADRWQSIEMPARRNLQLFVQEYGGPPVGLFHLIGALDFAAPQLSTDYAMVATRTSLLYLQAAKNLAKILQQVPFATPHSYAWIMQRMKVRQPNPLTRRGGRASVGRMKYLVMSPGLLFDHKALSAYKRVMKGRRQGVDGVMMTPADVESMAQIMGEKSHIMDLVAPERMDPGMDLRSRSAFEAKYILSMHKASWMISRGLS